jgi:rhodanese-related sulfurtransferase
MMPENVSPQTLKRWLEEGSAVLVDVREQAEHRAVHIVGSDLMPLGQLDASRLPPQKRVVVHCQKGARGSAACMRLLAQNPNLEVYNLAGGIEAWKASGMPVEDGDRSALPLDRQVQLTVGLLLLATTALSLLANPAWVWAAGAVGLGLSMAGLTGFCGMARVLAVMPWNR